MIELVSFQGSQKRNSQTRSGGEGGGGKRSGEQNQKNVKGKGIGVSPNEAKEKTFSSWVEAGEVSEERGELARKVCRSKNSERKCFWGVNEGGGKGGSEKQGQGRKKR